MMPRKSRPAYGEYLALFLVGVACGTMLPRAIGPLERRLAALSGSSPGAGAAAGGSARAALGRIHGLLGEIRGLMQSASEREREGGAGPS